MVFPTNFILSIAIMNYPQERIEAEKQRLGSIRLPPADPLVQAAAATSGQPVSGVISLEDVLRRPRVHYP